VEVIDVGRFKASCRFGKPVMISDGITSKIRDGISDVKHSSCPIPTPLTTRDFDKLDAISFRRFEHPGNEGVEFVLLTSFECTPSRASCCRVACKPHDRFSGCLNSLFVRVPSHKRWHCRFVHLGVAQCGDIHVAGLNVDVPRIPPADRRHFWLASSCGTALSRASLYATFILGPRPLACCLSRLPSPLCREHRLTLLQEKTLSN